MRDLPTFPIVKIELTGMQQTICHAMTEHLAKLDTDVRAAVEAAVNAYNPAETIRFETRRLIDAGIKKACEDFFLYGEGREAILKSVGSYLTAALAQQPQNGGAK